MALKGDEMAVGNALDNLSTIATIFAGKVPVVFLDYDGTLSPIIDTPDLAFMTDDMRKAVQAVASQFVTAIVTGRAKEKVYNFVKLDELYYAGSHGFDINGPQKKKLHCKVDDFRPVIETGVQELEKCLSEIPGVEVEDNKFALSVHYRNVDASDVAAVEKVVDLFLQKSSQSSSPLIKKHGKKVFELKPKIEWDKGKAVMWMLQYLKLNSDEFIPLYLGDDVTDEDAFKALKNNAFGGIGILVQEGTENASVRQDRLDNTAATFSLRSVSEVQQFLQQLVALSNDMTTTK